MEKASNIPLRSRGFLQVKYRPPSQRPIEELQSPRCTSQEPHKAMVQGAHKSCYEHVEFLEEEFKDMINKGQWIILLYAKVKRLARIMIKPPRVGPQRDRRPRWIVDYSLCNVNQETLPLAPKEATQFGHVLDRFDPWISMTSSHAVIQFQ